MIIAKSSKINGVNTRGSVQPGNDPFRNAANILFPQRAVFDRTATLVGAFPGKKQRHIIQRIEPDNPHAGPAQGQGQAGGHQDLAEVVYMAGKTPESAAQKSVFPIGDGFRFDDAEERSLGIGLE